MNSSNQRQLSNFRIIILYSILFESIIYHIMSKTTAYSLLFLLCSFSANAEIYKWVDEYGKAHFTDKPPVGKQTEKIEVKVNTYSAVEITPLLERLGREDKVVIYTTTWCGICKKAKKHFRKNNIDYVSYDIEKSWRGKRDYKALRGTGVPIIIIGDKRMNGFTTSRFNKLYKKQMELKVQQAESENEEKT